MGISKVVPRTIGHEQLGHARDMRNAATPAERKLWSRLRASSLEGHKFSRQIAVGPFICDLVCRRSKLIVEVDGGQHATDSGCENDLRRTRYLKDQGYTVLRFWNVQVLQDVDSALIMILAKLREMELRQHPHPQPLPQAGGEQGSAPPPAPPASGRGAE